MIFILKGISLHAIGLYPYIDLHRVYMLSSRKEQVELYTSWTIMSPLHKF